MTKTIGRTIIDAMRQLTPLWVRKKVGPLVGYAVYFFNAHVRRGRPVPIVLSVNETIELIKKDNLSIVRFGDGEMSFINNDDLAFQKKNKALAVKLASVLRSNENGLLVCVPAYWGKLDGITKQAFWFTIHHLFRYGHVWERLLSRGRVYGNASITRPYLGLVNRSRCGDTFKNLFSIWEGEGVVLIEGSKSRLGVGNDMFNNAASLQRILCPPEHAFDRYDAIKAEAMRVEKDKLILVSLGPAAKVLAYDLFFAGYRVIDVGHIDMEYEMFLRNEATLVKVPCKYFNEIGERDPEDCDDPLYASQIIATIL